MTRCPSCGETFPLYDLSSVASLAAGDDSASMPVKRLREVCPRCGAPIG